jgi:hypothetical protein
MDSCIVRMIKIDKALVTLNKKGIYIAFASIAYGPHKHL